MSREPIDYLDDLLPMGVTKEMAYQHIVHFIYFNVLQQNFYVGQLAENLYIIDTNEHPITVPEATTYFVKQYLVRQ